MNVITIVGRFTKDLELKKSGNGTAYIQNVIAVQRTKDIADFIPVLITGKSAEFILANSGKGKRVSITGVLQSNTYEKDGKKQTSYTVMANSVEPIDWIEKEKKSEEPEDELPFEV